MLRRVKTKMFGVLLTSVSFGLLSSAGAQQSDDMAKRLTALERENAAIRQQNDLLRENQKLRKSSALSKSSGGAPLTSDTLAQTPASDSPMAVSGKPTPSVFDAMAADLPVYKAARPEAPPRFQAWVEGGAIWSGGDRVVDTGVLAANFPLFAFGTRTPFSFDLTPKIGWEAATGFDYRFAASPWHVSGQFRYGQGGRTTGAASAAGPLDPSLSAFLFPAGTVITGSASASQTDSYRESHWLADLAAGHDIAGMGPDSMQLRGGFRSQEFLTQSAVLNTLSATLNFAPAVPPPFGGPGGPISTATTTTNATNDTRNSFFGAGPLVGLSGSAPLPAGFTFDYAGDAAILFGTQKSTMTALSTVVTTPASLGGNNSVTAATTTAERFAYVVSADIQAGLSYWFTPNLKLGASYRLDAIINVQNQSSPAVTNLTPTRYTHGPRITMTGQF